MCTGLACKLNECRCLGLRPEVIEVGLTRGYLSKSKKMQTEITEAERGEGLPSEKRAADGFCETYRLLYECTRYCKAYFRCKTVKELTLPLL